MGADVERGGTGDPDDAGELFMKLRRLWDIAVLRLRSLMGKAQVEQELDRELRFHFDQQVVENMAKGMAAAEALAAARREFGGLAQIQEECRDMRRTNLVESMGNDL